jgi:hypothetical protein
MRRKVLSELVEQDREERRLLRASFERHEQAFERHEQAFERHEQTFARHEEAFERVIASLDRHEARAGDLRVFIRDMNTRAEKVVDTLLRGNQEFFRELSSKIDTKTDATLAELKEGREESLAHREALLALIDRLPPPPPA